MCVQIIQLCEIFRAKVVDVADTSLTIEITGDPGKMVAFQNRMARYGIKQLARTGKVSPPPCFFDLRMEAKWMRHPHPSLPVASLGSHSRALCAARWPACPPLRSPALLSVLC